MGWNRISAVAPPVGRPVLVKVVESDEPIVAFMAEDGLWFAGGALVQMASTLLAGTPVEWCEPEGDDAL